MQGWYDEEAWIMVISRHESCVTLYITIVNECAGHGDSMME